VFEAKMRYPEQMVGNSGIINPFQFCCSVVPVNAEQLVDRIINGDRWYGSSPCKGALPRRKLYSFCNFPDAGDAGLIFVSNQLEPSEALYAHFPLVTLSLFPRQLSDPDARTLVGNSLRSSSDKVWKAAGPVSVTAPVLHPTQNRRNNQDRRNVLPPSSTQTFST